MARFNSSWRLAWLEFRSLVEELLSRWAGFGLTGGFTLGNPDWLMSGGLRLTEGGATLLTRLFFRYLLLPLLGFRGFRG